MRSRSEGIPGMIRLTFFCKGKPISNTHCRPGETNNVEERCARLSQAVRAVAGERTNKLCLFAVLGIKVELACFTCMATPFSFLACVSKWVAHSALRKRARSQEILLLDSRGRKHIAPTLHNISLNKLLLKPFTEVMAIHGVIRKSLELLNQAILAFYQDELSEEQSKDPLVLAKMHKAARKSSKITKSMLTSVKRKWARWENAS